MSEIGSYLAELRAHLSDLDPRRAEEIVAEVRAHLDARVKQFETSGLSRQEAVEAAPRSFGEPAALSMRLAQPMRATTVSPHCGRCSLSPSSAGR